MDHTEIRSSAEASATWKSTVHIVSDESGLHVNPSMPTETVFESDETDITIPVNPSSLLAAKLPKVVDVSDICSSLAEKLKGVWAFGSASVHEYSLGNSALTPEGAFLAQLVVAPSLAKIIHERSADMPSIHVDPGRPSHSSVVREDDKQASSSGVSIPYTAPVTRSTRKVSPAPPHRPSSERSGRTTPNLTVNTSKPQRGQAPRSKSPPQTTATTTTPSSGSSGSSPESPLTTPPPAMSVSPKRDQGKGKTSNGPRG
jgi:hypothetical protein